LQRHHLNVQLPFAPRSSFLTHDLALQRAASRNACRAEYELANHRIAARGFAYWHCLAPLMPRQRAAVSGSSRRICELLKRRRGAAAKTTMEHARAGVLRKCGG
jgi:hypothetical protein